MTKTIKLGLLLPKVCDGSSGIKCYREGKEIEHPHPMVRWRAGGELMNANISPHERKHDVNRQYRKTQEEGSEAN